MLNELKSKKNKLLIQTIFKSYGMKSLEEIKELEKEAKEYLEELNGEEATSPQIQEYISNADCYRYVSYVR